MKTPLAFFLFALFTSAVAAKSCKAESCSAEGVCENRECQIIEVDRNAKPAARGRIVSCKTCKLNHFESLRRWVKEHENWKEWQNLEMVWHQGHDPILFILDENDRETQRIDLTQYNYEEMEGMLRKKGFRMKGEYW
eukprot:GEMP01046991.1.p1 GENE.GEMP01046991.1~~GEMP01046991.1.p1  ORF type:complete len:137 (+),score=31.71 GEMP01046991.1:69-479(+)